MPATTETSSHPSVHPWNLRVPSLPHITIPPASLDKNGRSVLTINRPSLVGGMASKFANSEFLNVVTNGNFTVANMMLEWRYEWRRRAQKILPFIYLGPYSATKDRDFLREEGITLLLAVRDTKSAQAKLLNSSQVASELGIQYDTVDVQGPQELIAAFSRAIEIINTHLYDVFTAQKLNRVENGNAQFGRSTQPSVPGKVLVFCEGGNERSAAVVAAYLITMYELNLVQAIQLIQAQRFCANFDDTIKHLLFSYEAIVQAKRDVASSSNQLTQPASAKNGQDEVQSKADMEPIQEKKAKRTLEAAFEEDAQMGDTSGNLDEMRFGHRDGHAPFQDGMVSGFPPY
ncbi:MAG: hypothetical protein M1819_005310 [Sarea resinae]|nr:MAG: hypothetical protein M1819_005310 [Sarea resinae]